MTGRELLRAYSEARGLKIDENVIEIGPFGDSPEMAKELLRLIVSGKKRATCWACIDDQPPAPGTISVVTDWAGNAGCVIQTVKAQALPFSEVTWEMAREEGENERLEAWREEHERFFQAEAAREGYEFSESMPVIFEEFRVIWPERYTDD